MDAKAKTDPTPAALDVAATQIMGLADKFMLHMGMRPGDDAPFMGVCLLARGPHPSWVHPLLRGPGA